MTAHRKLASFSAESIEAFLASAPGIYDVEGERFEVRTSEERGLIGIDPSGNEVSALPVLARGRKISGSA